MLANLSISYGTYIKFWHNGDRIHAHEGGGAKIGSYAYVTEYNTGDSRMSVTYCTRHQTSLYVLLCLNRPLTALGSCTKSHSDHFGFHLGEAVEDSLRLTRFLLQRHWTHVCTTICCAKSMAGVSIVGPFSSVERIVVPMSH